MTKLAAKNISNGMEFSVEKKDDYGFSWEKGKGVTSTAFNPPIGSILIVERPPYKLAGVQLIDFSLKGDTKIYSSNWSTFKTCTKHLSGSISTPTTISIHSTGKFNGFDIEIGQSKFVDELDSGFSYLLVELVFTGSFTGSKKITSKMINDIKNSVGFAPVCTKLLIDHMSSLEKTTKEYIKKHDNSIIPPCFSRYTDGAVNTWYKAGKVEFEICLTDDYSAILKNIEQHILDFTNSPKTNLLFKEMK